MIPAIIGVFLLGYAAIAFEHLLKINKAASAVVTGVSCWTIYILSSPDKAKVVSELHYQMGGLSQILFFLLGAMTIVELVDAHDGFELITRHIKTNSKSRLLWMTGCITFFLSAILDNLTTTIVMISLLRKLIANKEERWMLAGIVIIAANAGGVWSPIGDVTTVMLWVGNQVSAGNIITSLFLPGIVCLVIPLLLLNPFFKGNRQVQDIILPSGGESKSSHFEKIIVLLLGLIFLLIVPVFKTFTHLPPFMGILAGLGLLWIITEMIHSGKAEETRKSFTVAYALRRIDTPSILFFLGILLAVAALEATGILHFGAAFLDKQVANAYVSVMGIGLLSSVVDNVPLVAAMQGMYELSVYPTDHFFWEFLAYTTGTGGSILIIGSAAGVAAMGMEKINFFWYLKKIGWLALAGYLAGAVVFILQRNL
jgi:Na+/H+ antiporter NhaD/arsenite permease-like protein